MKSGKIWNGFFVFLNVINMSEESRRVESTEEKLRAEIAKRDVRSWENLAVFFITLLKQLQKLLLQLKIKAKTEFAKIVASNNELKYELELARKEKIDNEPVQDDLNKKVEERVEEMKRTLSSYRLERKREVQSLL